MGCVAMADKQGEEDFWIIGWVTGNRLETRASSYFRRQSNHESRNISEIKENKTKHQNPDNVTTPSGR